MVGAQDVLGVIGVGARAELMLAVYQVAAVEPVSEARNEIALPLELPADAIVGSARVGVTASPAGRTAVKNVARVRPAENAAGSTTTTHVIDFGGLRTVSSLTVPGGVSTVTPWLGTQFAEDALTVSAGGSGEVRFTEVRTERLLVELAGGKTSDAVAAGGLVTISDAPADLEVLVGGERVTIRPGPVRSEAATFSETLDVTAAVQAAVDAGRSPIAVVLRSSVPARLGLDPSLVYLDAHRVQFPEGERRTVPVAAEGVAEVALPLGAGAAGWKVKLVRFELAGAVGDERVVPATGPALGTDAELVCDPDRPIAVRLPPSAVRRFAELRGIRLRVRATQAAELGGFLAAEMAGPQPGDPLKGGELAPTVVAGGEGFRWVTVPLARPVPAGGAGHNVWAVVQLTRGALDVSLDASAATGDDAALARRQSPNGAYRPLPAVTGVATAAVGLRVVGVPPPTAPIDAATVRLPETAGAPGPAAARAVGLTPGAEPVTAELRDTTAMTPTATGVPGQSQLVLRFEVSAPGDYTIGPVTVGYEETT